MTRIFSLGRLTEGQSRCHSERSEEPHKCATNIRLGIRVRPNATVWCFASLNMTKLATRSKRIAHAHLRSEKIQAGIRICLSPVGEMLIKRSHVYLPVVVHIVRNAGCRQNIKRKILALRARNFRVTVDPACTQPAGNVGNEAAARSNKVIAHSEVESEIMVFDSAKNRLRDGAHVKLVVTPQPGVALHYSPSNARR